MRSRMLAGSRSVARVEMESPVDGGAVTGEEILPLFRMAAPEVEIVRGEKLLERRACAGSAKNHPSARPRGAPNLPPQGGQGRAVHPVNAVEQDIAVATCIGLAAEPIRHRGNVGGDARQAAADRVVVAPLQVRRQWRFGIRAVAAPESLPSEIVFRQGEVASQMPNAVMVKPGEIAAGSFHQTGELARRNNP